MQCARGYPARTSWRARLATEAAGTSISRPGSDVNNYCIFCCAMVDQAERDAHRQKQQELQRQLRAKERSKAPSSTDLRIKREALLRGVGAATLVQRPSPSTRQPTYEQHRAAQLLAETAENEARRAAQREKQAKLREQQTLASGRARAAARAELTAA